MGVEVQYITSSRQTDFRTTQHVYYQDDWFGMLTSLQYLANLFMAIGVLGVVFRSRYGHLAGLRRIKLQHLVLEGVLCSCPSLYHQLVH